MAGAQKSVKLVNPFVPVAYALKVKVDLDTWSYEGNETVTFNRCPQHPLDALVQLHAAPSIEVVSITGAQLVKRDAATHTMHLKLDSATRDDSVPVVQIHFKHQIQEELRGFYRVRFMHDGVEHRMASTHFEPTSARLFFICQDEPAQRADFSLEVTLPAAQQHYTVLSNGPLASKEVTEKSAVYRFAEIPKCPPYLTACVIGELESISKTVSGIPVSVYTTLGKTSRAWFALDITAFALEYFERFFQCKFPLPKLDLVAVPDFPIGGMENWGCITCIESVLVDPTKSSIAAMKRSSELICHEVSHNWFGNLVAINWWEGLWLKEGFASWCGNHASHMREPSWKCLEDAAQSVSSAMDVDMHVHSHPVEVPINDPADITQIFDSISYDKGMGLVFMLEAFLGPEKWGPAVAHYIDKYRYMDTKTQQLWEALEESSGLPVTEAMNSFTNQMGYPLVSVTRTSANAVVLRQQPCRFASSAAPREQSWCIPVVLEGEDPTAGRVTFTLRGCEKQEVSLPASMAASRWVTGNPHHTGFYRCRYDDATFEQWVARYAGLSAPDRRALISDTVNCIYMGFDDMERVAAVAEAVRAHEHDTSVLQLFGKVMRVLTGSFDDEELRNSVRDSQLSFFTPLAERALTEKVSGNEAKLRQSFLINVALALMVSAHARAPAEVAASPLFTWAVKQAESYLRGGDFSAASLGPCLAIYLRLDSTTSTAAKNDLLMQRLKAEDGNDELCRALIYGLCMGPDLIFVKEVMKRCIDNNGVRSHFGGNVFSAVSTNPSFGDRQVWQYFQENFSAIDQQWGGGQFRIQVIVSFVGTTLTGGAAATEFEEFFKSHPLPNARLAIGRAAEDMRLREWVNKKWKGTLATILKRK